MLNRENQYLTGIDIWALGCVVYEMIFRLYLFNGDNDQELKKSHIQKLGSFRTKDVYSC